MISHEILKELKRNKAKYNEKKISYHRVENGQLVKKISTVEAFLVIMINEVKEGVQAVEASEKGSPSVAIELKHYIHFFDLSYIDSKDSKDSEDEIREPCSVDTLASLSGLHVKERIVLYLQYAFHENDIVLSRILPQNPIVSTSTVRRPTDAVDNIEDNKNWVIFQHRHSKKIFYKHTYVIWQDKRDSSIWHMNGETADKVVRNLAVNKDKISPFDLPPDPLIKHLRIEGIIDWSNIQQLFGYIEQLRDHHHIATITLKCQGDPVDLLALGRAVNKLNQSRATPVEYNIVLSKEQESETRSLFLERGLALQFKNERLPGGVQYICLGIMLCAGVLIPVLNQTLENHENPYAGEHAQSLLLLSFSMIAVTAFTRGAYQYSTGKSLSKNVSMAAHSFLILGAFGVAASALWFLADAGMIDLARHEAPSDTEKLYTSLYGIMGGAAAVNGLMEGLAVKNVLKGNKQ